MNWPILENIIKYNNVNSWLTHHKALLLTVAEERYELSIQVKWNYKLAQYDT